MFQFFLTLLLGFFMVTTPEKIMPSQEQKENKPVVVILLGPPGSGKGTQAVELSKTFHLSHISTGDLFRQQIKNETELGKKVKGYLDKGSLVPDEVVFDMLFERISQSDCSKGYLLDGFPRTSAQAHELEDSLRGKVHFVIFNLKVNDEQVINRLSGRLTCRNCGKIFHKDTNPPVKEGVCDACGGELYQRTDDSADVIKERLRVYYSQTKPLEEFYRGQGMLINVDSSATPQEVTKVLENKLSEVYPK